jgi:SAM-dependent methyltransferase
MYNITRVLRPDRRSILSVSAAVALGCVVIGSTVAAPLVSDDQIWQRFVDWLPSAPVNQNPQPIFDVFRARIIASGISGIEADRQMAVVLRTMRTRTDGWQVMFNKIYTSANPGYSTNPSALLVTVVEGRKAGRALDIGMGQGRNSVFLAMKGWDVTGFDISDEGLKVAAENANRAGVNVKTVLQSIQEFDLGTVQWDLIAIMYEPAPVTTTSYVEKISKSLRPGGLVVVESFASDRAAQIRRPVDIDPAELLAAFGGFRILHFEDVIAMPEWTQTKTRLTRLVAEKRR